MSTKTINDTIILLLLNPARSRCMYFELVYWTLSKQLDLFLIPRRSRALDRVRA